MNYQMRGGLQSLGPGFLTKNYEASIEFTRLTTGKYTLDAMLGEQWQQDFACFTYFKVVAFSVQQQKINLTDTAENVWVLFNFNRDIDGEVITNDSAKILPPLGSKQIIYTPNSGIVYVTKTVDDDTSNRSLNLATYNATSNVLINGVYHLPGQLAYTSHIDFEKTVRVVLRVQYKGSLENESTSKLQVSNKAKFEEIVKKGVKISKLVLKKTLLEKEIESRRKELKAQENEKDIEDATDEMAELSISSRIDNQSA
jgi:hypothetical protein